MAGLGSRLVSRWFSIALALCLVAPGIGAAHTSDANRGRVSDWVTLGTGGGPVIQVERSQPANALLVGEEAYLFDVGEGSVRQLKAAGIPLANVKAVFVSHLHLDHVGGLAALLSSRWVVGMRTPVTVIGPHGIKDMIEGLIESRGPIEIATAVGSAGSASFKSTFVVDEIDPDTKAPKQVFADKAVRVITVQNDHFHDADGSDYSGSARSYSFRIEAPDRSIVYSGDTGPSEALTLLAKDADLLVSEVIDREAADRALDALAHLSPEQRSSLNLHMQLNHLSAAEIAEMANRAQVKAIVLTHLVPGKDGEPDLAGYLRGIEEFRGPVKIANDLDRF